MDRFAGVELVQQIGEKWQKVSHYAEGQRGTILNHEERKKENLFAFLLNLGFMPAQVIEIQKNEKFILLESHTDFPTADQIEELTGIRIRP